MSDLSSQDLIQPKERHALRNARIDTAEEPLEELTGENVKRRKLSTSEKSVRKVVDLTSVDDEVSIVVRDGAKETTVEACVHDQFQKIFGMDVNDSDTKIEYKNTIVSKYVTPHELGYQNDGEPFFLIRKGVAAIEKTDIYSLKINVDVGEDFMVRIDKNQTLGDLLSLCADISPIKRDMLVMNGVLLNEKDVIQDVIDDGDTLDYVVNH
jgi:hypothetical protein